MPGIVYVLELLLLYCRLYSLQDVKCSFALLCRLQHPLCILSVFALIAAESFRGPCQVPDAGTHADGGTSQEVYSATRDVLVKVPVASRFGRHGEDSFRCKQQIVKSLKTAATICPERSFVVTRRCHCRLNQQQALL